MSDEVTEGVDAPTETEATVETSTEETTHETEYATADGLRKMGKENARLRKRLDEQDKQFGDIRSLLEQLVTGKEKKPEKSDEDEEQPKRVTGREAMSRVEKLERKLAFKDALSEVERPLTKAQKRVLSNLFEAQMPKDVDAWLDEQLEAFPEPPKPVETKVVAPPPPKDKSNTGAPVADKKTAVPGNPLLLDGGQADVMSNKELLDHYRQYKNANSREINIFATQRTKRPGE